MENSPEKCANELLLGIGLASSVNGIGDVHRLELHKLYCSISPYENCF